MTRARYALGLLLACACGMATGQPGPIKALVTGAIDAPDGTRSRQFTADEQWVQLMRRRLETKGPVTVTARVVRRFRQEGCATVETTFLIHEARIGRNGNFEDVPFSVNVNTCRDGLPPSEALDVAAIQRATSPTAAITAKPPIIPVVPLSPSATASQAKPR